MLRKVPWGDVAGRGLNGGVPGRVAPPSPAIQPGMVSSGPTPPASRPFPATSPRNALCAHPGCVGVFGTFSGIKGCAEAHVRCLVRSLFVLWGGLFQPLEHHNVANERLQERPGRMLLIPGTTLIAPPHARLLPFASLASWRNPSDNRRADDACPNDSRRLACSFPLPLRLAVSASPCLASATSPFPFNGFLAVALASFAPIIRRRRSRSCSSHRARRHRGKRRARPKLAHRACVWAPFLCRSNAFCMMVSSGAVACPRATVSLSSFLETSQLDTFILPLTETSEGRAELLGACARQSESPRCGSDLPPPRVRELFRGRKLRPHPHIPVVFPGAIPHRRGIGVVRLSVQSS